MLQSIQALFGPAVLQRLTLLANHVLSAEPAATQRLRQHVERRLQVELIHWPALLPALPTLVFEITPAGLLEWRGQAPADGAVADLLLRVDAANPALLLARLAAGERPEVEVQGDAQCAADVHWLAENLRWDFEADLARLIGPMPARQLARLGAALAAGLRRQVQPAAAGASTAP